jgi:hypothetical protein
MASQISDDHIATFATESTWNGLATALVDKYEGIASRFVQRTCRCRALRAIWRGGATHIGPAAPGVGVGSWTADYGSAALNHYDHVHIGSDAGG